MKRKYLQSCICCLVIIVLSSCIKESSDEIDNTPMSRTILIYLAGDNNESDNIGAVIEQIRKGWSYTGCNSIIYYDAYNAAPKLLRIRGGCDKESIPYIEEVAIYPEENSASEKVLAKVINEVVSSFPAESYGLIFASHASGWLPYKAPSRSIGMDNNANAETPVIELGSFSKAIPDHQFDFIIFETCLMAGVEVLYELKDKANYILASSAELLSPGFVPIYKESFSRLATKNIATKEALRLFGNDYMAYINKQQGAWRSATLSLIKTDELDSLSIIAEAIFKNEQLAEPIRFNELQHFDRPVAYENMNTPSRFFDLEKYLHLLGTEEQNRILSEQISKVVLWKSSTNNFLIPGNYSGFKIKHHSGLTSFIENGESPLLNLLYKETAWYKRVIGKRFNKRQWKQ